MEEQKRIFDVNCITCSRFFECNGKVHSDQLCVNYEERKEKEVRHKMDQANVFGKI